MVYAGFEIRIHIRFPTLISIQTHTHSDLSTEVNQFRSKKAD